MTSDNVVESGSIHPKCKFADIEGSFNGAVKGVLGIWSGVIFLVSGLIVFYLNLSSVPKIDLSISEQSLHVSSLSFFVLVSCHHIRVFLGITFINFDDSINATIDDPKYDSRVLLCRHDQMCLFRARGKRKAEKFRQAMQTQGYRNGLYGVTIFLLVSLLVSGWLLKEESWVVYFPLLMAAQLIAFWTYNKLNWYRLLVHDVDRRANQTAIVTDTIFSGIVVFVLLAQFGYLWPFNALVNADFFTDNLEKVVRMGAIVMVSSLVSELISVYSESLRRIISIPWYALTNNIKEANCGVEDAPCMSEQKTNS